MKIQRLELSKSKEEYLNFEVYNIKEISDFLKEIGKNKKITHRRPLFKRVEEKLKSTEIKRK